MTRRRRWAISGVVVLLAIVAAIVWFVRPGRGVRVSIEEVRREDVTSTVTATGRVRPAREVRISPSIAGEVVRLAVREGQRVEQGDVLAQLDRTTYQTEFTRARAALDLAQAAFAQSRTQWERAQALFERELISRQEMEAARTQYLLDRARVNQARATLELALHQLRETTITSPISGTVTQLEVEMGETVVPGTMGAPGTALMVIADLEQMEVACEVDETDIAQVSRGQAARIRVDALADQTIRGAVVKVSEATAEPAQPGIPQTESPTVDYTVTVAISDTIPALRPGMTASVDIITARKRNVLVVPIEAVVTRPTGRLEDTLAGNGANGGNGTEAVFVYENGVARLVPGETGAVGGDDIQVTNGLADGQQVITGPFSALRELQNGARVEPEER